VTRKLTQEEARAVMLAANLQPLEPYKSSGAPWKCRCQKGTTVKKVTAVKPVCPKGFIKKFTL